MKASTSASPSDDFEEIACTNEETTEVEVDSMTGGKCSSEVDITEEICVASHVQVGAILEEKLRCR